LKILVDTNVLVWAYTEPERLPRVAAAIIADQANSVFVSAASAWEIGTRVRIGKLPEAEVLETDFISHIQQAGFTLISIHTDIALRAARFTGEHRDPFDRIIAAHALALDIPVISPDKKLDQFHVRRIW
jgi:PIN domain nuclease of toxin-antitoxin system